MKTIKLPYFVNDLEKQEIEKLIFESSNMIRLSYNRFVDGLNEKDIRNLSKIYKNVPEDSWLIQSSIRKAQSLYETNKTFNNTKSLIFGGKFNFFQRCQNKISKDQYKNKRNLIICSQGEKIKNGNRKFSLDLQNNQIIFKINRQKHINLKLPNLRKNYLKELFLIENLMNTKQLTLSVELDSNFVYLSFDEKLVFQSNYKGNENIVSSIDMNPNYIGFSICKYKNNKQNIIYTEIVDISHFTKNLHKSSNDKKTKYQNNKQEYELSKIAKYLIEKSKKFNCGKFVIEDLNIKSKDSCLGKGFNRLCNNKWNRNFLVRCLNKHSVINNIDFIEINPVYTSFIGNIIYDFPDMVAASIEINRRGYYKYIKNQFYPNLINRENLSNRWKEAINWSYSSWKELFDIVKTSKLKYRRSLESFDFKVFRFNSSKSFVNLYKIYNNLEY